MFSTEGGTFSTEGERFQLKGERFQLKGFIHDPRGWGLAKIDLGAGSSYTLILVLLNYSGNSLFVPMDVWREVSQRYR
jgi:hypothetical protein